MKTTLMRMLAALLVAVTLLGVLSGCNTTEPEATKPSSSIGSTENTGTDGTEPTTGGTDDTTEPEETTGTTETDPAGDETISGTENTEPTTEPTTEPSTTPTEPSDETEACAHKYSPWETVDPTCTKDGSKSRSCANCGKTEKETLKATGHAYGSWSTTKAATCSAAGSKERKCSACGYKQTDSIAALDHKYGSWSTTKAATCDTNGTKTRKCSGCGKTETQSIAATGHVWDGGKVTTQPTSCSAMGIKTFTCKNCGKTRTEQIKGNHTFGEWKYEEYTYKQDGASRVSHRKVRSCTKCGYKEYGNTPDHYCARGSDNHKVTTVKEGTCTTKAKMRSTCKICGWYVEYDGKKGKCNLVEKNVHLSDYGTYTNELDATVSECTSCGAKDVTYSYGKGFSDYNRYRNTVIISQGTAFASRSPSGDDFLKHPTWQTVIRDHKYDSDGYVKQFTVYWHDASGNRYSYVVDCTPAHLKSWFAEYGLEGGDGYKYQLKISGSKIVPYKISWTG